MNTDTEINKYMNSEAHTSKMMRLLENQSHQMFALESRMAAVEVFVRNRG